MDYGTIFILAVSLAMDAFAVSAVNGASVSGFSTGHTVKQGAFFGGAQFLMPVLGWLLGSTVSGYIDKIDHWIAFLLLGLIGLNMIRQSLGKEKEAGCTELTNRVLFVQALATSVDALAVGISFALLDVNVIGASVMIGLVSFFMGILGGVLGRGLGQFLEKKATLAGGIVLILIGVKILLTHTMG